jgi:hypothetical protein
MGGSRRVGSDGDDDMGGSRVGSDGDDDMGGSRVEPGGDGGSQGWDPGMLLDESEIEEEDEDASDKEYYAS